MKLRDILLLGIGLLLGAVAMRIGSGSQPPVQVMAPEPPAATAPEEGPWTAYAPAAAPTAVASGGPAPGAFPAAELPDGAPGKQLLEDYDRQKAAERAVENGVSRALERQ